MKFFNPQPDLSKASQLADEISKVLKNEPPEMAMPKVQGLLTELSKMCNVTSVEARVSQIESTVNNLMNVGLGVTTLFLAYLMVIPSAVYMVKLNSKNEVSKLQDRVVALESTHAPNIPSMLTVDATVTHKIGDSVANSTKNQ